MSPELAPEGNALSPNEMLSADKVNKNMQRLDSQPPNVRVDTAGNPVLESQHRFNELADAASAQDLDPNGLLESQPLPKVSDHIDTPKSLENQVPL